MEKVVVGLSGGIDSFMTAYLLKQRHYEVVGVHLCLWDDHSEAVGRLGERLGISTIRYEAQDYFRQEVVQRFVDEYSNGQTPNPCAICNNHVKWFLLQKVADSLGIRRVATGHYVRILPFNGLPYIHKGVDAAKDQSYFLWGVQQPTLERTLTPLGDFTKQQVRQMAIDNGFADVEHQRESMGICFIGRNDYRQFIEDNGGRKAQCGDIVDRTGQTIGQHKGLPYYTIGQKRDMPLKDGQPLYVAEIDSKRNRIVADEKAQLFANDLQVEEYQFIDPSEMDADDITVKVRGIGLNPEGFGRITQLDDRRLRIDLETQAWAVASGQPVAFYRGERLIGGGICRIPSR